MKNIKIIVYSIIFIAFIATGIVAYQEHQTRLELEHQINWKVYCFLEDAATQIEHYQNTDASVESTKRAIYNLQASSSLYYNGKYDHLFETLENLFYYNVGDDIYSIEYKEFSSETLMEIASLLRTIGENPEGVTDEQIYNVLLLLTP